MAVSTVCETVPCPTPLPVPIKRIPFLQVKTIRTETYEEKVPYDTEYVENKKHYLGYEQVKVSGRDGEREVVAEVELVDGVEQKRTVLESRVTMKPVNRVVIIGAKCIPKVRF